MTWFFKLKDWLQHIAIAVVLQFVIGIAFAAFQMDFSTWNLVAGATTSTALYYGREERDHENRLGAGSADTWKSWCPWLWGKEELIDFLAPVGAVWAVVAIRSYLGG